MKKHLLTLAALMLTCSLSAQNVARECVLFEVFTGVNCPYCPAAANGIMDMLEQGYDVAAVAFHDRIFSEPEFYTDEVEARKNLYVGWVSGYPTSICDGTLRLSGGGNASQTLFGNYSNWYNQRKNVQSPFTIELSYQHVEGSEFQVTAVVNKVGECTAGNMRLVIALTESHINRAWQGMSELNAVTRDLIPTQNGTVLTSDSQTVTETFSMEGFPKENMQLVAWVQSWSTKEVFQAVKLSMESDFDNDVAVRGIDAVVTNNCSGLVEPIIEVKNLGKQNVTSMEIESRNADNLVLSTYTWNGNVAANESVNVDLPEFDIQNAGVLNFVVTKVNGVDDEEDYDNVLSLNMGAAVTMDGNLEIQLKTPEDPQELVIDVEDMQTGEVIEHITFAEGGKVYKFNVYLPSAGCFRLKLLNPNGTGCGKGFGVIKDGEGKVILNYSRTKNVFTYRLGVEMVAEAAGVGENMENMNLVYPNPATTQIYVNAENISSVEVYNSAGQLVYSRIVDGSNLVIDASSYENGIYLVNVTNVDGTVMSQKVVVRK